MTASPFDLDESREYERWRARKFASIPSDLGAIIVKIQNITQLSASEKLALSTHLRECNMVVYDCGQANPVDKNSIRALGREFGLERLDKNMGADDEGITELEVKTEVSHKRYIPYTNRAIGWHTDGYYNLPEQSIHAMVLHCVAPAYKGGENALLDHELAYIHLRDINPNYISALMQPDVMTIPANIVDGKTLRPDRSSPVFHVDDKNQLHMRFTERKYNIIWKDDPLVKAAVEALISLLHSHSPFILRCTLGAGQGLLCNNVLHDRTGFENDEDHSRLILRLRYYDQIIN